MARRIALVLLSLVAVVVVAAGGLLAWIAWFPDTLKQPLERVLSAQVGQPVRIEGPLDIDLGRVTTVELQGLRVAAPEWAQADNLAAVERLRVGVDVWAYLRDGAIRLTELDLDRPRVALERNAQGQTSWPSDPGAADQAPDAAEAGGGTQLPTIESMAVTDGHIAYQDAVADVAVEADVASVAPEGGGPERLRIDGEGTVRGEPLDLALRVGSPELLAQSEATLPIQGEVTLAGTRATLDGEVRDPKSLSGITLAFDLASEDPRQLLALAGQPVDQALPPLTASARLTRPEEVFRLEELRAEWGESRVEGELAYDPRPERPTVTGELRAPRLDLVPLWPALTGGAPEPPSGENPLSALSGYDADVRLSTGEVRLPQLTLRETEAHARLGPGGLTVDPLRVAMPEGQLVGRVATGPVDQEPLTADVALNAEGINLAQAVPGDAGVAGVVNGELRGTVRGATLDAILDQSRLEFEGRAENLSLPQAEFGTLVANARLENGRIVADPLRADLPEGRLAGRVEAGPFGEGFTANVDLVAEDVGLAAVARSDAFAGVLNAEVEGTLEGSTPSELLTRSRIELRGDVDQLRLPQLGERVPSASLVATIDPGRPTAFRLVVEGRGAAVPLRLAAWGASADRLAANEGDYPVTVEAEAGEARARVNGTVALPLGLDSRLRAEILLEGSRVGPVFALFGLPDTRLEPFRVTGELTGGGAAYQLADLDARVGDSRATGDLAVDLGGPRPSLSGELRAPLLDADDFGGLVGAQPGEGEEALAKEAEEEVQEAQADGQVIPQERIEPSRWQAFDLDLRLSAEEVSAERIPLDGFEVAVLLEDGLLRVDPLVLRAGEGSIEGQVELDAEQAPVSARVDLDITRLPVGRLLNQAEVDVTTFGELSGRARGDIGVGGTGMGVQEILANADGEVTLVMRGGSIDRTLVSALGFDLLRLFGSVLDLTSERVELRCTLADLAIRDGIVRTRSLLIDTPIANIRGEGTINLETEEIDLALLARPDETPLATDQTGIAIGGTLAEPEVEVNPAALAARGIAAATLGVLLKPFTTLTDIATDDPEAPCARLLQAGASGDTG